ncbi:TRAM domain-containing protein [Actinomycetaceae bacterium MB13-C1-2]|nr:TRAM domain-containing protein [Actinomycetaceae bacterium MB13-C1-2]
MADQPKPSRKKTRGGAKVRARKARAAGRTVAKQGRKAEGLPSEPLTLQVERVAHGGAAVGRAPDGRTVFVRGAIPGETVRARVTADHKKFMWADTDEVLEASEHRIPHVWPDPPEIGSAAADLGHVDPYRQLAWKSEVLADQMRRIGGEDVAARIDALYPGGVQVQPVSDSPSIATRTRIQLIADSEGRLGMKPYRSDQVVALEEVPVATAQIQDVARFDPTVLGSRWKGRWGAGDRVQVEAPNRSRPVVVTASGVYDAETAVPFEGPSQWAVCVDGTEREFRVRPGGFWQTHLRGPEVLARSVMKAAQVQPGETVMELYSGAGLFSRFLADAVGPSGLLLTLEGDATAVEDAGANLIDAVEDDFAVIFEGKVDEESVAELFTEAKGHVDTVVLDPPRKGAGFDVVRAIAKTDAGRVVLVSCDPVAAARDIRDLVSCGFRLESIEAWDLFPGTHHFETVAELVR